MAAKPNRRRSRTLDVGLVIAALSVLVALGTWLWPRSPEGPDPPPPPPSPTRGELVGFLTKVLWHSSKPGAVTFTVQWEIRGFRGQACRIGWSIYNQGHQPIGLANDKALTITVEADTDRAGYPIEVTAPTSSGRYYVVFTIYAPNGSELDSSQSPAFDIA